MDYHLRHWGSGSGSTSISRVYVNADDRSTLGWIERRTFTRKRRLDTYYDRHRVAKGDTDYVADDTITTTLPAAALSALKAAMIHANPRYAKINLDDDMELYQAAKQFSRGIDWIAPRPVRKALKAAADAFSFEF